MDRVRQFVLKKVVHPGPLFLIHLTFKTVEIDIYQSFSVIGMKEIAILCRNHINFNVLLGLPFDFSLPYITVQVDLSRPGYGRNIVFRQFILKIFILLNRYCLNIQFPFITFESLPLFQFIRIIAVSDPTDSVVVQTDP